MRIKFKASWTPNPNGNLWQKDESNFGQKLLSKMGWKEGKGLGKNEDGNSEALKVKYKNDKKGVGWKELYTDVSADFSSLLANLNEHHCNENTTNGKSQESEIDEVSLESHSKKFKNRLHYQKYIRGKDVSKYSEKDMQCILADRSSKHLSFNSYEEKNVNMVKSPVSVTDYFSEKWKNKKEKLSESIPVGDADERENVINKDVIQESHMKKKRKRNEDSDDNCSKKSKCDAAVDFMQSILKGKKNTEKCAREQKEVSFSEDVSCLIIENRFDAVQCSNDPEVGANCTPSVLDSSDANSVLEFEHQKCEIPFLKLIKKPNKKLLKSIAQDTVDLIDLDVTQSEITEEGDKMSKKERKRVKRLHEQQHLNDLNLDVDSKLDVIQNEITEEDNISKKVRKRMKLLQIQQNLNGLSLDVASKLDVIQSEIAEESDKISKKERKRIKLLQEQQNLNDLSLDVTSKLDVIQSEIAEESDNISKKERKGIKLLQEHQNLNGLSLDVGSKLDVIQSGITEEGYNISKKEGKNLKGLCLDVDSNLDVIQSEITEEGDKISKKEKKRSKLLQEQQNLNGLSLDVDSKLDVIQSEITEESDNVSKKERKRIKLLQEQQNLNGLSLDVDSKLDVIQSEIAEESDNISKKERKRMKLLQEQQKLNGLSLDCELQNTKKSSEKAVKSFDEQQSKVNLQSQADETTASNAVLDSHEKTSTAVMHQSISTHAYKSSDTDSDVSVKDMDDKISKKERKKSKCLEQREISSSSSDSEDMSMISVEEPSLFRLLNKPTEAPDVKIPAWLRHGSKLKHSSLNKKSKPKYILKKLKKYMKESNHDVCEQPEIKEKSQIKDQSEIKENSQIKDQPELKEKSQIEDQPEIKEKSQIEDTDSLEKVSSQSLPVNEALPSKVIRKKTNELTLWAQCHRDALRFASYKNLYPNLRAHPVLYTSNLDQITGYGNF